MRSICIVLLILLVSVCWASPNYPSSTTPKLPPGGLQWINCTRPHEHYSCGSACQTECATLGQPCPIVNIRCNDACYCDEGFARNSEGTCIPISQC